MMRRDPLDSGDPRSASWEEFRASFAAPRLQLWMLEDSGRLAGEYLDAVERRWYEGFVSAELLAADDPEYDGAVPLQAPDGRGVTFLDADVAHELYNQLFPHGHGDADFLQASLGLVVIGLHSAFESYARRLGISDKPSLPKGVTAWLNKLDIPVALESGLVDAFRDCDATRHLYVHNRGIVDQRYVDRVPECNFVAGERRRLDTAIVADFADALWRLARILEGAA